ncbi:MAG: hypothetical protein M1831_000046 [Alyxoria varia]|nr:MAG: hypothetical protein M1831_000046 [Alyxoria varia]
MATYSNPEPSAPRPIPQPSQPRRPSNSSAYLTPNTAYLPPGASAGTTPPQHVHFDDPRAGAGPPPQGSLPSNSYSSQPPPPPQFQAPYGTSPSSSSGAYPPRTSYHPPGPSSYPPQGVQYVPVASGGSGGGGGVYSGSPPGAYPPPPETRPRGWSHGSNTSHSSRHSRQSLPASRRASHSPAPQLPLTNQYIPEGYPVGSVPAPRVPSRSADPYYRNLDRPAEYDYDYEGRRRRYSANPVDRYGRPVYSANEPDYDDYDRDEYYDERRRRRRSESGIDPPRKHGHHRYDDDGHHRKGRHEKTTQEIKDEIENRPTLADSVIAAYDTVRDAFSSKRH